MHSFFSNRKNEILLFLTRLMDVRYNLSFFMSFAHCDLNKKHHLYVPVFEHLIPCSWSYLCVEGGVGCYRIVTLYNLAGRTTKLEVVFEGLQHLLPLYFFPLLPVWSWDVTSQLLTPGYTVILFSTLWILLWKHKPN